MRDRIKQHFEQYEAMPEIALVLLVLSSTAEAYGYTALSWAAAATYLIACAHLGVLTCQIVTKEWPQDD